MFHSCKGCVFFLKHGSGTFVAEMKRKAACATYGSNQSIGQGVKNTIFQLPEMKIPGKRFGRESTVNVVRHLQ